MKYLFFEPTLLTSVGGVQTCAWNLALEMHRSGREVYLITGQGALPCPYPELSAQIMAFPFIDRKHFSKALGRRLPRIREGMSLVSASWDFLKKHASDSALIVFKPHDITGFGSRLKEFKTVCLHSEGTDFVALDRFYAKKYITKISAASHFNAWQIRSHFKRPVHVVYNGVPEYFIEAPVQPDLVQNWRKKMGADMGTRVFGYVGRMVGW